jgi:hypothetical protein
MTEQAFAGSPDLIALMRSLSASRGAGSLPSAAHGDGHLAL